MEIPCNSCKLPYGTNYLKCLVCAKKGSKRNVNRYRNRKPTVTQPKNISVNDLSLDDMYGIFTSSIDYSPIFIKFILREMTFCEDLVLLIMSKYLKSSESHIQLMTYEFDCKSIYMPGFMTLFNDRELVRLFKHLKDDLDQPHGIMYDNSRWCFFTVFDTDSMAKVYDLL